EAIGLRNLVGDGRISRAIPSGWHALALCIRTRRRGAHGQPLHHGAARSLQADAERHAAGRVPGLRRSAVPSLHSRRRQSVLTEATDGHTETAGTNLETLRSTVGDLGNW